VIAWIVGYSFCVMAPKTNGAKGLAITLVSLGGVNVILRFIARIMPIVSSQSLYGSFPGGLSAFGARDRWMSLLVQLSFCAELIILPMFLAAVAKARKARQDADASMVACFVAIGYTVVVFIMLLLPMVLSGSTSVGRSWSWFSRILGWLRNIGLLVYLGLMIKAAFSVRRRAG
jgi:hypothetical protein